MTDHTALYASLHASFNRLTNRCMIMTSGDLFRWELWTSHGWTEADLALVVNFINRRIKSKRRWPESLRLHNLIDPARFADDIQDARGEARQPKPTPRQSILATTHRPEPDRDRAMSAGAVMRGNQELAKLLALRDRL